MQYDNSSTKDTTSDASALLGDRELEEQTPEFSLDPSSAYMRTEAVAVKASVLTVLLYGGCSVGMNFVNKATLNSFRLTNVVLLLQMVATLALLVLLRGSGLLRIPPISWAKARALLPMVLLYNANVAFALMGLKNMNIAMYSTLKRLTPMIVLVAKALTAGKWPHSQIIMSVVLVVSGCLVAGFGDLSFHFNSYLYAFVSCGLQSAYLIIVEKTGVEKDIGSNELLINSLLSIPFLVPITLWMGELQRAPEAFADAVAESPWFPLLLVLACYFGMLLNYSLFLCTLWNSALTTTIVGVLKGAFSTVLGFFFLVGDSKFGAVNVIGILMNMSGGMWYTYAKWKIKSAAKSGKMSDSG